MDSVTEVNSQMLKFEKPRQELLSIFPRRCGRFQKLQHTFLVNTELRVSVQVNCLKMFVFKNLDSAYCNAIRLEHHKSPKRLSFLL